MRIITGIILLSILCLTSAVNAATHTIKNNSDRVIKAVVSYRGHVEYLNLCNSDSVTIEPKQSFVSKASGCPLRSVKIEDGDKVITADVRNYSKNVLLGQAQVLGIVIGALGGFGAVGVLLTDPNPVGFYGSLATSIGGVLGAKAARDARTKELVVLPFTSSTWEYDGEFLKPTSGVAVFEK